MKPIEKQKAFMDLDLVEREKEEELVIRMREVKKGKPIKNKKENAREGFPNSRVCERI